MASMGWPSCPRVLVVTVRSACVRLCLAGNMPNSPATCSIPSHSGCRRIGHLLRERWPVRGSAFLWFNTYPAQVFMGDIGALAVGAALGTIAVIVQAGSWCCSSWAGCSCMETAVGDVAGGFSFKLTGKRIFRMAPIHHHFELKGWPEPRVIVRFWIISVVLVLVGLATLKVR
jgi:hypothetical protein